MSDEEIKRGLSPNNIRMEDKGMSLMQRVNGMLGFVAQPTWAKLKLLLVVLVAITILSYITVEVLVCMSYKHQQKGQLKEAIKCSRMSCTIGQYLYPSSPEYFKNILVNNLTLISNLDAMGAVADPFYSLVSAELSRLNLLGAQNSVDSAQILLLAAKIENSSGLHSGAYLVQRVIDNKLLYQQISKNNPLILAELKEEMAYSNLVTFFASTNPKTNQEVELNDKIKTEAQRDHEFAQKTICRTKKNFCEFNEIRWLLGSQIRSNTLGLANNSLSSTNTKRMCMGISINDCYAKKIRVSNYYFNNSITLN